MHRRNDPDLPKDEIIQLSKEEQSKSEHHQEPWKVLIVDDENDVHTLTYMVMEDYKFEGRGLSFLSAYSGKEAKKLIREHPDIALILLDVVMESDDAGLDVVRYIREELENRFVRIILRTGQPGQAPENDVVSVYDINDYKEKTELTAQKLFTTVTSSLRAYRDIRTIEKNRRGLEKIIGASASLFEMQSIRQFATAVLEQFINILYFDEDLYRQQTSSFAATRRQNEFYIFAATGRFKKWLGRPVREAVSEKVTKELQMACNNKESLFINNRYIGYFNTQNGLENLIFIQGPRILSALDKDLIRIFSSNVGIAFDNIYLNQEIIDTQKVVIHTLGEVVESRSKETANHVVRVSEYAYLLSQKAGFSEEESEILRLAAPMHDVGKIGIPDAILNKPSTLNPDEFELMKAHTTIGYNILKKSDRKIMQGAAVLALQHHEQWDGKGYPEGLKGEEIHVYGRITCIADVFDALANNRVYKKAWGMDLVRDHFKNERERRFDPYLTDLFLENFDDFVTILKAYPDEESEY